LDDIKWQEEYLQNHYKNHRDLIKEENTIKYSRMGSFGTFQGFLWAAGALSLNRSDDKKDIWVYLLLLSIIGILSGVMSSFFNSPRVHEWDDFRSPCAQKGINYLGPDIISLRAPDISRHLPFQSKPYPLIFMGGWVGLLVISVLIKRGVLFEEDDESLVHNVTNAWMRSDIMRAEKVHSHCLGVFGSVFPIFVE
jgi:hypothetical protein